MRDRDGECRRRQSRCTLTKLKFERASAQATAALTAGNHFQRSRETCAEERHRQGALFEVFEDEIGRYVCGAGGDSLEEGKRLKK